MSKERIDRAYTALTGLSVGDAFGERFFWTPIEKLKLLHEFIPEQPWHWTDDTAMAISIYNELGENNTIDQDSLAQRFAERFSQESGRGYGKMAMAILAEVYAGTPWREAAGQVFNGTGSMGNGGAMRVAPVGAYFADDLEMVAEQAKLSAQVTHMHPEGQAGAIAAALASASAWQQAQSGNVEPSFEFLRAVYELTPASETKEGILRALQLPLSTPVREAVRELGNGSRVIAQDTVPYCLWCAARHLNNYEEALWQTASGYGDVDTTCAIVGGIVVMATGVDAIPVHWLQSREPLGLAREP